VASTADRSAEVRFEATDLSVRLDGIRASIDDLESRVRVTELATGDEKTAKELRRALEALAKHDPRLETRLTDRVDVLADRLATIGSTVSTTAASLARKDGEIASLRRDLESGDKRLEELTRQLESNGRAGEIERLRAAVRAVQAERPGRASEARVDDLGRKLAFLSERIDTLATTVGTTAAGLAGREGELATLRERLDRDSARIDQATAELERIQDDGSLAHRLDALETALDATAAELSSREIEGAALRARIDESYTSVGSVVTELQNAIATLSARVRAFETFPAATEQALESRASELDARIDELVGRVAELAGRTATTVRTIEEGESEVAALGNRIGAVSFRVEGIAAELEQVLDRLQAPGAVDPQVEARLADLGRSVAGVTDRLAALSLESSARSDDSASRSSALERSLASVGEQVEALERDRAEVASQLERAAAAWSDERGWVRARLDSLAAAQGEFERTKDALVPVLGDVTARLGAMESGHAAATREIARLSAELESERETLHEQLDGLAVALAEDRAAGMDEESSRRLVELGSRVESVEQGGAAFASEIAALRTANEAERAALHSELEGLAAAIAETRARSDDTDSSRELGGLSTRLRAVEANGAAAAAELARSVTATASELRTIERRLDEIAASSEGEASAAQAEAARMVMEVVRRLDAVEEGQQVVAAEITRVSHAWHAQRSTLEERVDEVAKRLAALSSETPPSSGQELAELRSSIDSLRQHLTASEQQLVRLDRSGDADQRLEEVMRRVHALEQAPLVVARPADGGSLPGDGRFRLELRALELRMEHAEAAARENREAVLVQLERLATRIEWRFQRLEAEHAIPEPHAVGGQVVPLRPEV
jgi:chromosome segregation ATPase